VAHQLQLKSFQQEVRVGDTVFRAFLVHMSTTQKPRRDRELRGQPRYFWVAECELCGHRELGPPAAFGVPIAADSAAAYAGLRLNLRFASPAPPLVLYHGTSRPVAMDVAATGALTPRAGANMLGPGVYLARWDKAASFAQAAGGSGGGGGAGGCVRRVVAFTGKTQRMTADMVCTCGCGAPFVDHAGVHGRGFTTTYVADDSLPATRRAEWCVHDPDVLLCEGVFSVEAPLRCAPG
jgi:hypothetical protein